MESPDDTSLPFFAYGIFKPGQLSHHQIEQFVAVDDTHESTVEGILYERDGTPLLTDSLTSNEVNGHLVRFKSGEGAEGAYAKIGEIEPESQYDWSQIDVAITQNNHERANVLRGARVGWGGEEIYDGNWDGGQDPLFNCALEIVEDTLDEYANVTLSPSDPNLEAFFEMQMAYSLLWSSIERYVSLRYGLRGGDDGSRGAGVKLKMMADSEGAFTDGLDAVTDDEYRPLRRTDEPQEPSWEFRPHKPEQAIMYYYRVRSNLVHRGKRASVDFDLLKSCLRDLYRIFAGYVLPGAFGSDWQRDSC